MTEEPFITPDDIAALKARDARWREVELAIKIDEELRDSPTVNLILDAIARRSQESIDALVDVDPLDTRRITSLQEKVKCARFIAQSLKNIREAGLVAQQTLEEEGNVELDGDQPPHAGSER